MAARTSPPSASNAEELVGRALVLCEGADDKAFLRELVKKLTLDKERMQVIEVGGKDRLRQNVRDLLLRPGWTKVRGLLLTRDADANFAGAQQALSDTFAILFPTQRPAHGQLVFDPDSTMWLAAYVFPGSERPGCLEDLCLATREGDPIMGCVHGYIRCLNSLGDPSVPASPTKARVHAYLAAQRRPTDAAGAAARMSVWDFEHPCLDDLKQLIRGLDEACQKSQAAADIR